MSVALDPVDLSAVTVGSQSPAPLSWAAEAGTTSPMAVRAGVAHLRLFNESGAGLKVVFSNGASDRVPAGGWPTYELKSGQTSLTWTVEYLLPGAPVSQLLAVFYEPGEAVPDAPVLGNSPIGIGGSVTTSATSALKQDGSGPATSLIEATPSDQASSSWAMNNDASGNLSVLSAGVLRDILRVVRGNAGAGKASVTLGDAGDPSILTMHGTADNASAVPATGVTAGALPAGVTLPANQVSAGNMNIGAGTLLLESSAIGSNGAGRWGAPILWPSKFGNGTFSGISYFAGTGTGTFTHGLTTTPVLVDAITHVANSTQTMGYDSEGATTVHITTGTGLAWRSRAAA